ncbi:CHAT domain-containing protein [Paraburkholderia sp. J76]|uniref:CHAT domain-containing protein n=1 Tax=Paraburkholderia sp. J76 TaxID=2805439 RepID=UPI002ABE772D|nr:CHAT domain-containing protein [Paraburkholderia sp. J76]
MNTTNPNRIALITDDMAKAELIGDAHESIGEHAARFPAAAVFSGMQVTTYTSTDKAHAKIFGVKAASAVLGLIVLDAMVRKERDGLPAGNGGAAIELLDWLADNLPHVPVIVLTSRRVDGLDLRLRKRRNIVSLSLAENDFNAAFSRALDLAVNGPKPSRQRIGIVVGDFAAHFYRMDGSDVRDEEDYEYRNLPDLEHLLTRIQGYSPSSNAATGRDWQADFREFGNDVYNAFITGTIGHHIVKLFETEMPDGTPVDIRFDINVSLDERARLFEMPFELARPPGQYDNFLCTSVPMARRIHFSQAAEKCGPFQPNLEPKRHDRPLRVLFINASFKGGAEVKPENGGPVQWVPGFDELKNTADELTAVKAFATTKWKHALERVTVVTPKPNQTCDDLREKISLLVKSKPFDILHFAGHSITLDNNGGTFLILPDGEGRGKGVSIREVADWVGKAGIRVVLLSSCSGSSLRTAIEVMRNKAQAVLGFRWTVDDGACVEYFRQFYRSYLIDNKSISEAYYGACRGVRNSNHGLPIWASAVAIVND